MRSTNKGFEQNSAFSQAACDTSTARVTGLHILTVGIALSVSKERTKHVLAALNVVKYVRSTTHTQQ